MDYCFRSLTRLSLSTIVVAILLSSFSFTSTEAYDALDPNGNITIKWDIISWTPDGYVAVVTMYNFQQYRHVSPPGWTLGWTWAKKEVIWSMMGAQTTEQGDCSRYKTAPPHCCKKTPTVVDLLPGTPYNQQIANCCKGGVINSWAQSPDNYASSFQVSVGAAGTTNKTVKPPKNFTLLAPGPGYTCGPGVVGKPTKFITADGRRVTQAMMTWNVTCTYSQFLVQKTPTCCVSLSSFYNETIVPCPTCTCGCQNNITHPGSCVNDSGKMCAIKKVKVVGDDQSSKESLKQLNQAIRSERGKLVCKWVKLASCRRIALRLRMELLGEIAHFSRVQLHLSNVPEAILWVIIPFSGNE